MVVAHVGVYDTNLLLTLSTMREHRSATVAPAREQWVELSD
jgi:hypothetical protein